MKFRRSPIILISAFLTATLFLLIGNFQFVSAQAAYSEINLGSAGNYLLLAGSAITNGANTTFSGDASRSTGLSPTLAAAGVGASLLASGSTFFDDGGDTATAAQLDLANTFAFVDSLTVLNPQAVITNETLTAGIYGTESSVALSISGTLTLDGAGDNRSIFIIRTGSALDFAASTAIILINGAQASNIYWVAGSALTMGASSTAFGNLLARSAMTIGANSVVTGSVLTQGALTLGDSVSITHQARIPYVAPVTPTPIVLTPPAPAPEVVYIPEPVAVIPIPTPTPTPLPTYTPEPEEIVEPIPTPTIEVTIEPTPSPTIIPTQEPIVPVISYPKPSLIPNAPLSRPTPQTSESSTPVIIEVVLAKPRYISRNDFALYDPLMHPRSTVNTAIGAFAALTLITAGGASSQGYLAQVARGSALAAGINLGRGDRRRARKDKKTGRRINFFTTLATRLSSASPLAARVVSDASYIRASIGTFSLFTYPLAIALGYFAARSAHFQGLPPVLGIVIVMMALGILDAMAGFLAGAIFSIAIIASGNVTELKTFLTLSAIVLMSFSPGILAGTFRPLRRIVDNSRAAWERGADYILASVLSGWVVKQIATGLPGLSGLQLPIASHAHQLGVIAGILVALRFVVEDVVSVLFPDRMRDLEPEYHIRNTWQKILSGTMQVLVFALVAQPFIGWNLQLWIGISIFTLPILLALAAKNFPHSKFLDHWLPTGIIEMLVMTLSGYFLAQFLGNQDLAPARYVLIAFVVLSIPGFVLKVLPLFAGGYQSHWRDSSAGNILYRITGSLSLGALLYIIFSGLLISNTL